MPFLASMIYCSAIASLESLRLRWGLPLPGLIVAEAVFCQFSGTCKPLCAEIRLTWAKPFILPFGAPRDKGKWHSRPRVLINIGG